MPDHPPCFQGKEFVLTISNDWQGRPELLDRKCYTCILISVLQSFMWSLGSCDSSDARREPSTIASKRQVSAGMAPFVASASLVCLNSW